jgi:hypothetical protein
VKKRASLRWKSNPPMWLDPIPNPTSNRKPPMVMGNDNIKKLSGREYQNLMRIVRHYAQEKITLGDGPHDVIRWIRL